jgi:hypothetical protein
MNIHTMLDLHPADRLGQLKAEIACLEELAELERTKLIALGQGPHEGTIFRATVSTATRETVDWKAICAKLKPSYQLITAHTSSKSVTTVRVASRQGV